MAPDRDVWERQPRERSEQHSAFLVYVRSDNLGDVAGETRRGLRTINEWSTRWGWTARKAAYLEHRRKSELDKLAQDLTDGQAEALARTRRNAAELDEEARARRAEIPAVDLAKLADKADTRLMSGGRGPGSGAGPAAQVTVNIGQLDQRVDSKLAELEGDLAAILSPDQWQLLRARRDARRADSPVIGGEVL